MTSDMIKRILSFYFVIVLFFGVNLYRIFQIQKADVTASSLYNSTKTIIADNDRGKIYDCNGERLVCRKKVFYACVKPTSSALVFLQKHMSPAEYENVFSQLKNGSPVLIPTQEYWVHNDITMLSVNQRYSDDTLAQHIIGYLDEEQNGVCGIERAFNSFLKKSKDTLSVSFPVDGTYRSLSGEPLKVNDSGYDASTGIKLTIDRSIQKITESVLDKYELKDGAAVVLDVKTGAIRAMASRPLYNRNNLQQSLCCDDAPFLNKALCAYSVGSVFKSIVACIGLETKAQADFCYRCVGECTVSDTKFCCYQNQAHGWMNLDSALKYSCNCFFISYLNQISKESFIHYCEELGLGKSICLAPDLISEGGYLPTCSELDNPGDYANLSFGQGPLTATPLQIAAVYNCIAHGGLYLEPYLIEGYIDSQGRETGIPTAESRRIFYPPVADTVTKYLAGVLSQTSNQPFSTTACGKTSTAQSGCYENGKEICRTWFAGFFPEKNPQYTVVILNANGSSGSLDCAPIFRTLADEITLRS